MELGTFLPFLKIAYRRGADNGIADFLSRHPTFAKYVSNPREVTPLGDDLFEKIGEVPLFTHELGGEDEYMRSAKYELYEPRRPAELENIWQAQMLLEAVPGVDETAADDLVPPLPRHARIARQLPSIAAAISGARESHLLMARID